MPPETVTIPATLLRQLFTLATSAQSPMIRWNESAARMHQAADEARRKGLDDIIDLLQAHIPPP